MSIQDMQFFSLIKIGDKAINIINRFVLTYETLFLAN